MGLLCTFNVVLPWNRSKSGETFQIEEIHLEALEESLNFQDWELSNYDPELGMKLSTYREVIRLRQAFFHRIQRLNTHMPFMLES